MKLNAEQMKAIQDFAAANGRNWKSVLRECWMTVQYPRDCDSASLQQIRNSFGPTWLVNFRLPQVQS